MLPAINNSEQWYNLNKVFAEHLNIVPPSRIRFFPSIGTSLFEITFCLSRFLAHKKTLGLVQNQTPFFHDFLPFFYKETYQIKKEVPAIIRDPERWINSLPPDTLLVIFAEDHFISGEIFPWEQLDNLLNSKKIFSIRISHFLHKYTKYQPPLPFSVQIRMLKGNLGSFAICGDRIKMPPIFSQTMSFNPGLIERILINLTPGPLPNPKDIIKFEKELSSFGTPFFKHDDTQRIFDRSFLSFEDINGSSLLADLDGSYNKHAYSIVPISLCCSDSHNPALYSHWWNDVPSHFLRGSVLFSCHSEEYPISNLLTSVSNAYRKTRAKQFWD